jgi:hypothetical protein
MGRIFRVEFIGSYTPEDVKDAFATAFADPDLSEDALFLMDLRYSDSTGGRSVEHVRQLADWLGSRAAERGKRFAVVVGEPVQYGVIRMASVFAESHGIEVQLFEEILEALAWLGVSGTEEDTAAGGAERGAVERLGKPPRS